MEWLLPHLTAPEQAAVAQCMARFDDPAAAVGELRQTASALEELQKRHVARYPAQNLRPELRGGVLVCTVGFRPMPVILSILLLQPRRVYLLHTGDSLPHAQAIARDPYVLEAGLDPTTDILLHTVSLTNAPQNYGRLQTIINENRNLPIVVDITGGVKVMGLSLAAAAFWLRIPVVYQLGQEVKGTVRPFSEQLTELENPYAYFGSSELRSLQALFHAGNYDAALAICQAMQGTVGDAQTRDKLHLLEEFITVYRDWDNFVHSHTAGDAARRLATRLRVILGKLNRLSVTLAAPEKLQQNLHFLHELEISWQATRNNAEAHRLIDIYAAAQRRGRAGKYDDAVARLYRCVEMSATLCLVGECGLGNVDRKPDFSYFIAHYGSRAALQQAYRTVAGDKLKPNRLGLKDQMLLLSLSPEPRHQRISNLFQTLAGSALMEYRNRSTLAHGTVPVAMTEYTQFDHKTAQIVAATFADPARFHALLAAAQHPPISIPF